MFPKVRYLLVSLAIEIKIYKSNKRPTNIYSKSKPPTVLFSDSPFSVWFVAP